MTPRPANDCAHERRPGTTVCLYCRADERAVVRRRRQRQLMRVGAWGGAAALTVAVAMAGVSAIRGSATDGDVAVASAEARGTATDAAAAQAGLARPVAASPSSRPTAPIVPPGRTPLAGGFFAERTGDTVTVNFDRQGARTRRSDKFESVVRQTLPVILGEPARMALDRVAPGTLVAPGQLVAAAGGAPLRLPVGDGRVVTLEPVSRMGQDGPLVVTYRAVVDEPVLSPTS